MKSSKPPTKPTAGFCGICGTHHDPDVPCFDQTGQALNYLDIPKNQQSRRITHFHKWVKITAGIFICAPLIILLWTALVSLSQYLRK